MPSTQRHIDEEEKTLTIEFSNESTFGPFEWNPITDVLTLMIAALEGRLASLEQKAK